MERERTREENYVGCSLRYLRELREKWLKSKQEEAQAIYLNAVREYNKALVLEGEI